VATSPDSFPDCSPDSGRPTTGSLDSPGALDAFAVSLGAAVDLFIAAKAAEGASERTLEWYRMITGRAVRRFGSDRPVDRSARPSCGSVSGELPARTPGPLYGRPTGWERVDSPRGAAPDRLGERSPVSCRSWRPRSRASVDRGRPLRPRAGCTGRPAAASCPRSGCTPLRASSVVDHANTFIPRAATTAESRETGERGR
jgi:hypothetical protein